MRGIAIALIQCSQIKKGVILNLVAVFSCMTTDNLPVAFYVRLVTFESDQRTDEGYGLPVSTPHSTRMTHSKTPPNILHQDREPLDKLYHLFYIILLH